MQVDGFGAMIAIVVDARTQTLLVLESCTPAMFDRDRDNCGVFRARLAVNLCFPHGVIWPPMEWACFHSLCLQALTLLPGTWRDERCLEETTNG